MSRAVGVPMMVTAVLFVGQGVAQTEATGGADLAFSEAQYAIAQKDCQAALGHLREVIALAPERADVQRLAGDCALKLDRPEEALGHYREWARLRPGDDDAAAAVERADARRKEVEERREARQRERDSVKRVTAQPSLAEAARARARDRAKSTAPLYTLVGPSDLTSSEVPAPSGEKRVFLLDTMRERAEAVLRPAMTASAADARQLTAARRRYADACVGKTASSVTEGVREGRGVGVSGGAGGGRWGEWAWAERWRAQETRVNEETVECRTLASDIARLSDKVSAVLAGCETELARSPAVYRGVREEVFARLEGELW
jgi:hypothetical protein